MNGTEIIAIVGGVTGFGTMVVALVTTINKKQLDEATIAEKVEGIYGSIIKTLEKKVKELEDNLYIFKCDNLSCKKRTPPKCKENETN